MSVLRHIVLKDASNNPVSYDIGSKAADVWYDPINNPNVTVKDKIDDKADAVHSHNNVSTTSSGFMSIADKTKLDNDQPKQLSSTMTIGNTDVTTVESALAALNANKAGTGVATTTVNGLMAATDKVKVDQIDNKANTSDVNSALNNKLDKTGGTITNELTINNGLILGNGNKLSKVTFSTTDLTPGTSTLTIGELYFVYEV